LIIILIVGELTMRGHAAAGANSHWLFKSLAAIFTIVVIMLFLMLLVFNILAIAGAFCNAGQQTL